MNFVSYEINDPILNSLPQYIHQTLLKILFDSAIPGKGTTALDVTGHWADDVRIGNFVIDIGDEGTAGPAADGYIIGLNLHICSVYYTLQI